MFKYKLLVGLILLLFILSVLFQVSGERDIANFLKCIILPSVTVLYFLNIKNKTLFFSLFLIVFSFSDLMTFIKPFISYKVDYYLGNSLYILAYSFLLIEIFKSLSFSHVIRNFKIHLFVLTILNIYIVYVLQVIVDPYVAKTNEYYIELTYNIVMLLLLSVALVNYFYRDNIKSLYLFLGSLCVVFSEVIWVAYTYISDRSLLNVLSITLFVAAIYFLYKQSELEYDEREEANMLIH